MNSLEKNKTVNSSVEYLILYFKPFAQCARNCGFMILWVFFLLPCHSVILDFYKVCIGTSTNLVPQLILYAVGLNKL